MTQSMKKFEDPLTTLDGSERAHVPFKGLETLWFNTGSLCNLTCQNCFMESSPTNDSLVYLSLEEVLKYVDEAKLLDPNLKEIGFTGGEPFLNKEIIPMLRGCLERGVPVLVLTNAMKPLRKYEQEVLELNKQYPNQLTIRVSLDHYTEEKHDQERGEGGFRSTLLGIQWLSTQGIQIHIAGRSLWNESVDDAREGYQKLFETHGVVLKNSGDLIVFPEMNPEDLSPPEITTGCWDILKVKPSSIMCATSRMVIKEKGAEEPTVARCTLLPYDKYFNSGTGLKSSFEQTYLKHVYCAQFCVLGGASCST